MLIKYPQNPIENADKKYLKIIGLDMSKHFCLVIKTFWNHHGCIIWFYPDHDKDKDKDKIR